MNKILLIISFFFISIYSDAQAGSWKIKLNNKTLLATSQENETTNSKKIKLSEWKKSGKLEIIFIEAEPNTWRRSFLFYDKDDNQLLSKDSTTHAKIPLSYLRKIFAGKKEIRIYTIISPLNPNIAIRVRRVHLFTLKLS